MAKITGNQPYYKNCKDMQAVIDDYFKSCEGHPLMDADGTVVTDKYGVPVILDAHPPTVTGLALALGFTGRQGLLNYQGRPAFVDTVTRAKAMVEKYCEERLFDREGQRGAEFSLQHNFRWREDRPADEEDSGTGVVEIPAVIDNGGGADG